MCLPGHEEKEIVSFWNLAWLYVPCMLVMVGEAGLSGRRQWIGARIRQAKMSCPLF